MNHKFDELTKSLAQSVTRRAALKEFGVGLAGVVLATLGLANTALGAQRRDARGCDHCNIANNFGCKTVACYNRCYAKCVPGGPDA